MNFADYFRGTPICFRKDGEAATVKKIMAGLESEARATDADRKAFMQYLEGLRPWTPDLIEHLTKRDWPKHE
jgi:hypothetical protein